MSKANELDQYYTNEGLAAQYVQQVLDRYGEHRRFLEPSAGKGAFIKPLSGLQVEAYDLEPKAPGIVPGDFLTQPLGYDDYVTVGNPPFILDVEFFNRCAQHSDVIAFIIPRSWRKASIINRLDPRFKLVHDEDCPSDAFILDGEPHNVSTCFQIWEKTEVKRDKIKFRGLFFDSVKFTDDWDICLRCYGSRSGEVLPDDYSGNQTTVRFLKSKIPDLKEIISNIDWTYRKTNVSSVPTINPIEIEREIESYLDSNRSRKARNH